MNEQRTAYFDTTKAFLIMLVVMGHVLIVMNPGYEKKLFTAAEEFIYTFHMSAFFILHGVLFNNEKWQNITAGLFIRKRLYSLVIPYLFFEMLGILCRYFFQGQALTDGLWNDLTVRCNVGADWFLIAMFMGSLLFLIYVKHSNRIYAYVSTVLCLILPIFCSGSQLLIVLGRGLLAYSFIMIGNLGKDLFKSAKVKSLVWILAAFLVTAVCALVGLKFGGNDYFSCTIKNPLILVVGGCSGTVMMLGISQWLQARVLALIGRHTLTIMGTHQLVIYALTALVPGLYGGSLLRGGMLLMAIVVFEIPVVCLIDRYLPFLVGRSRI